MTRSRRWLIVVVAAAFGVLAVGGALIWLTREYCTIATLDCGNGRHIVLSSARSWEYAPPLYYQVFDGNKEVVPRTSVWLGDLGDRLPYDILSLSYRLYSAEGGQVVGIVPKELPYAAIVLHDFATNQSWPHLDGHYGGASVLEAGRKWQSLRERLEAENPEISLLAKVDDSDYLRKVDFLYFCHSGLTDGHLAKLRGIPNIETLHLDDTAITDKGLEHLATLPGLCHLSLANTAISDNGLAHLSGIKALDWIDLSGTNVTPHGVEKLRRSLPADVSVWHEETDRATEHRRTPSK